MSMFDIGETAIDKRTHECADVIAVIPQGPDSLLNLYVLRKNDNNYYIADHSQLIKYNKYYWDDLNKK